MIPAAKSFFVWEHRPSACAPRRRTLHLDCNGSDTKVDACAKASNPKTAADATARHASETLKELRN
jgi:hypothetical protein